MQETDEAEPAEVEEVIEVVTAAKLMTKVVTTATTTITYATVPKANQVKRKERQDNIVMRYQALKRKPVTEEHARKNMMVYLKNMAGFKMDFLKGLTYTEIRPIFEKHYNSIHAFLEKGEKEIEEEPNVEASTWRNQRGRYGLAKVKSSLELMLLKTSRKYAKGLLLLVKDLMLLVLVKAAR
nr:hypothetical protein [Tanacetum cinerariifolium]